MVLLWRKKGEVWATTISFVVLEVSRERHHLYDDSLCCRQCLVSRAICLRLLPDILSAQHVISC
jgi:hypothetical protein